MDFLHLPSPIEEISFHPGTDRGIRIFLKRDDLIHPEVSGNKWRKLKWNIEAARKQKATTLISAGGAWSNHLAATAAAGKLLGFSTVGFVRGEQVRETETLVFCQQQGMKLIFTPKPQFDALPDSVSQSALRLMDGYFIPLGGDNELGRKGCAEIMDEVDLNFDLLCVAVGTGTTLRGLADVMPGKTIQGFSALKNASQHSSEWLSWLETQPLVSLSYDEEFGGFARSNKKLEDFIVNFYHHTKIMLDPVYNGKMMYRLFEYIQNGSVNDDTVILCIHTGGLQGIKGFPDLHNRLFTS